MKQALTMLLALATGLLATSAQAARSAAEGRHRKADGRGILLAQNTPAPEAAVQPQAVPRIAEGTPVVVVGVITSEPKAIVSENKMQVAVGPARMDYTLHLSDAKMY